MLQFQQYPLHCFIHADAAGVDSEFWFLRHFIRVADAGEFLDDAGASFGVEAFAVAPFTYGE